VLANQFTFLTHSTVKTPTTHHRRHAVAEPGTVFGANVTIGYAQWISKYPYRAVVFNESNLIRTPRCAQRRATPVTRNRSAVVVTHATITPLNAVSKARIVFITILIGIVREHRRHRVVQKTADRS